MAQRIGSPVTAPAIIQDDTIPLPSHYSNLTEGGLHSYATIGDVNTEFSRDGIKLWHRRWGMLCSVYNDPVSSKNGLYILKYLKVDVNLLNNANWDIFRFGSTNITKVNNLDDLNLLTPTLSNSDDGKIVLVLSALSDNTLDNEWQIFVFNFGDSSWLKIVTQETLTISQKVNRSGDTMQGILQIQDTSGFSLFLDGSAIRFAFPNDNRNYFNLTGSGLNFYQPGRGSSVNALEIISPRIRNPINLLPEGNVILDIVFQNTYAVVTSKTKTILLNKTNTNIEGILFHIVLQQDQVGGWQPVWDQIFNFPYGFDKRLNSSPNDFTTYTFIGLSGSLNYLSGGKQESPPPVTPGYSEIFVADAQTLIPQGAFSKNFRVLLNGDRILGAITNPIPGVIYGFQIIEDAVGDWKLMFDSSYVFPALRHKGLSMAADQRAYPKFTYESGVFVCFDEILTSNVNWI